MRQTSSHFNLIHPWMGGWWRVSLLLAIYCLMYNSVPSSPLRGKFKLIKNLVVRKFICVYPANLFEVIKCARAISSILTEKRYDVKRWVFGTNTV